MRCPLSSPPPPPKLLFDLWPSEPPNLLSLQDMIGALPQSPRGQLAPCNLSTGPPQLWGSTAPSARGICSHLWFSQLTPTAKWGISHKLQAVDEEPGPGDGMACYSLLGGLHLRHFRAHMQTLCLAQALNPTGQILVKRFQGANWWAPRVPAQGAGPSQRW